MNYFIEILFIGINAAMAAWHAHLIKNNRPIKHGLWSALYGVLIIATCAVVWHDMKSFNIDFHFIAHFSFYLSQGIVLAASLALVRELTFSPILNYFRGLSTFYISDTSTSILDKWEGQFGRYLFFISIAVLAALQYFLR